MRNRVGKLVVATLLAMLLVFGVATAETLSAGWNADRGVYYIEGDSASVNGVSLCGSVAGTATLVKYVLWRVEGTTENKVWEYISIGDALDSVTLFPGNYKIDKNVTTVVSWYPQYTTETTTTTHNFVVKGFANFTLNVSDAGYVFVNNEAAAVSAGPTTVSVCKDESVIIKATQKEDFD